MIEILKELLEKPENTRAYIISILKILLSVIVASKVYILIFGEYDPILIGDFEFWKSIFDFIVNGRIMIVLGIFFFVRLILLEQISAITFLILTQFAKIIRITKNPIEDDRFFRYLFNILGVLKFHKVKTQMPEPGRNFYKALEIVNEVDKKELNSELTELKNTTIFETFNIFIIFSIVYFYFLPVFHHHIIDVLIVGVILWYILTLIVFEYFFTVLESTYDSFSSFIKLLYQIKVTNEYIIKNGLLSFSDNELIKNNHTISEAKVDNKTFQIFHYFDGLRVFRLLNYLKEDKVIGKKIIVTQSKIPKRAQQRLEKASVKIIKFKNKEKYLKKLEEYLFHNKNKFLNE